MFHILSQDLYYKLNRDLYIFVYVKKMFKEFARIRLRVTHRNRFPFNREMNLMHHITILSVHVLYCFDTIRILSIQR